MEFMRSKLVFAAGALVWGMAACAEEDRGAGPASRTDRASLELLQGWEQGDGTRMAGLDIRLEPGWKTYWRAPGDAGVPPRLDWSGSENVAEVEVLWPAPQAFESYGMTTLGYRGEVTLPIRVRLIDPQRPASLRLALDYGVCADICVPESAEMAIEIAPGETQGEAVIAAALADLPQAPDEAGLTVERCTIAGAGRDRRFEGSFRSERGAYAVVEGPESVWFDPAELRREGELLHVSAKMVADTDDAWVDRADLRVTLLSATGAVEINGCTH